MCRIAGNPNQGNGYHAEGRTFNTLLLQGKVDKVKGSSRSAFLNNMAKSMGQDVDLTEEILNERINKVLPKDAMDTVKMTSNRQLGMLHKDDAATYSGIITNIAADGVTQTSAIVYAVTLVKGYMVSFNLYREFVDRSTFKALLKQYRGVMKKLVSDNLTFLEMIHQ